ncbi:hypothetical protein GMMP1_1110060 [Candidatus Magnetomoraceae bacterium gMMP-1]
MPQNLEASQGNEIEIPINISGVAEAEIEAYAIRLDYDESILSNPRVVDAGTLSEGNSNIQTYNPPSDGIGKFSVGTYSGFTPTADGVLIKVKFDVSSNFYNSTIISFASKNDKTVLSSAGFEKISSNFVDGSLVPGPIDGPTVSLAQNLEASPGGEIEIPINISEVAEAGIGAYAIRLDYDESILSNPRVVDAGTLSEGNSNIQTYDPPSDSIGKFSVGTSSGFNPTGDGILIKVKFDVSIAFSGSTSINFVSKNDKTTLSSASFEIIPSNFTDCSISAKDIDGPIVSLAQNLEAFSGEKIEVPINISGVAGAGIGAYAIRLDYDESVLSNPRIVDAGTLSEGNLDIETYVAPSDGIGKFSVGIGSGFNPAQDGTLIKVLFDVSSSFTGTTNISFVAKNVKTVLSKADFSIIASIFNDGSLLVVSPPCDVVASFITDPANAGVVPLTVEFNASASIGDTYEWNFGDGTTGTGPQINHIYTEANIYMVTLSVSTGSCTTSITKNITVLNDYTISASAGTGGVIEPSGEVKVGENDTPLFTITPYIDYEIKEVIVDGNSVGIINAYEFESITENHIIEAVFMPVTVAQHIIITSAGAGGSIKPNGNVVVDENSTVTFTITPDPGYEIDKLLVDNKEEDVIGKKYTTQPVSSSYYVNVSFVLSDNERASISGQVIDNGDGDVSGYHVEAKSETTGSYGAATTDKNGNYTIVNLEYAKDFIVWAAKVNSADFFYNINGSVTQFKSEASQVKTACGEFQNRIGIDIHIEFEPPSPGNSISGKVTDKENGTGVAGIFIFAWSDEHSVGSGTYSDENGDYVITGLPDDTNITYTVSALPDSKYKTPESIEAKIVGDTGINFELEAGFIISGKVKASGTNNGIADVEIEIISSSDNDFYRWLKTNDEGKYTISGIPDNLTDYIVIVTPPEDSNYESKSYEPSDFKLDISDNNRNIELESTGTISGYVKDSENVKGLSDILVIASPVNDSGRVGIIKTGEDGSYTITNLTMGISYKVIPKPVNYVFSGDPQSITTSADGVNFTLITGGSITGWVYDPQGNPINKARVKLKDDDFVKAVKTNQDGVFTVSGLSIHGEYMITVYATNYPPYSDDKIYKIGGASPNLTVASGVSLTGTVKDTTGSNPPDGVNVVVKIFKENGGFIKSTLVNNNDGSFEFTGLSNDNYQLFIKVFGAMNNVTTWVSGPADSAVESDNGRDSAGSYPNPDGTPPVNFKFDGNW